MKRKSFSLARAFAGFAGAIVLMTSSAIAAGAPTTTTLDNLQAAYNGESNAHVRYVAFAKKADIEGYHRVARLFRAAAQAEAIHRENHAVVIKKMGATPTAKVEDPIVQTTQENLAAAIKGETYERDTMYPQFLAQARADKNSDAVRTFNFAQLAEKEHAAFYREALANIGSWKDAGGSFYVCPVCGSTRDKIDFSKCNVCGTKKEKWEAIN